MKIFSVPMIVYATAYARADSADSAFAMAKKIGEDCLGMDFESANFAVPLSGLGYDNPKLPDFSISPVMTIGGPEEHIENIECVHEDGAEDIPEFSPLTPSEALERIRARLAGEWFDPTGDLESDIKSTLKRVETDAVEDTASDEIPMSAYERAACAHGWEHGGDNGGFWYNGKEFDSWKAAASSDDCATYATAKEVCESEGLYVSTSL